MKRNWKLLRLIVAFMLVVPLAGCFPFGTETIEENGQIVTRSFSYDGSITRIVVGGVPAVLHIKPESSGEVTYTINENLVELLNITHLNGELRIESRNNQSIDSDGIEFEIGAQALEGIVVDGAATIRGSGIFTAEAFVMEINGAATAELALNMQNVLVNVNGAANNFVLSGTTEYLRVNFAGAGNIDTHNLIAQHANIELSGVGSILVYAAETLNVSADGLGSVTYWGNPVLTYSAEGFTSVIRGN